MRVLFNLAIVAYEAGDLRETLERSTGAVQRACALGVDWSFYAGELRHLQVMAGYMIGEWDTSLAAANQLARVPEMAAHVRADGLLVLVGRGDPSARERRDGAPGLAPRPKTQVLLGMVTAAPEMDLAAREGCPRQAVGVAQAR